MMRTDGSVTVFIADRDTESRSLLSSLLTSDGGSLLLGSSGRGEDTVEQVCRLRPDVLVTELLLPERDGFSVIRELRSRMGSNAPAVVMLGDYTSPAVLKDVGAYSVSYFFLKPVPAERLLEAVRNAGEQRVDVAWGDEDIPSRVTELLLELGVPAHLKGYQFLREAIMLALRDPDELELITKRLYPSVALSYGTDSSRVERAMRHAIEVAFDRGDVDTFQSIFGYTVSTMKGKPTNSEFISTVADHLSLHLRRRDGERMFTVR